MAAGDGGAGRQMEVSGVAICVELWSCVEWMLGVFGMPDWGGDGSGGGGGVPRVWN